MNQRITHTIFPPPCSLAESFTFSAKEKDSETGLSYFGARYYSSDLSIWLSVDPQASKYPSLSPYSYCANNPIKLVDSDGEDIEITTGTDSKGNQIVNIRFTAVLVNNSSHKCTKEEMLNLKNEIASGIKEFFSGDFGEGVTVNTDVDIICSEDRKAENFATDIDRHTINIVNKCSVADRVAEAEEGGNFMNIKWNIGRGNNANNIRRTAAHEFGHLLGLKHNNIEDNLMKSGGAGTFLSTGQIREAVSNFHSGRINNGISSRDLSRMFPRRPDGKLNDFLHIRNR
ncbi:MAG: matrixin family metalloprotease [Bacteroidales bacterium]|nr:matrixin family metalloprotease [Bacteroidales bacterium]